jgi:hypothetical protein
MKTACTTVYDGSALKLKAPSQPAVSSLDRLGTLSLSNGQVEPFEEACQMPGGYAAFPGHSPFDRLRAQNKVEGLGRSHPYSFRLRVSQMKEAMELFGVVRESAMRRARHWDV